MNTLYMASDLRTGLTYIVTRVRKGSRKLIASAMTARGGGCDVYVPWGKVPAYIRRAAKEVFNGHQL